MLAARSTQPEIHVTFEPRVSKEELLNLADRFVVKQSRVPHFGKVGGWETGARFRQIDQQRALRENREAIESTIANELSSVATLERALLNTGDPDYKRSALQDSLSHFVGGHFRRDGKPSDRVTEAYKPAYRAAHVLRRCGTQLDAKINQVWQAVSAERAKAFVHALNPHANGVAGLRIPLHRIWHPLEQYCRSELGVNVDGATILQAFGRAELPESDLTRALAGARRAFRHMLKVSSTFCEAIAHVSAEANYSSVASLAEIKDKICEALCSYDSRAGLDDFRASVKGTHAEPLAKELEKLIEANTRAIEGLRAEALRIETLGLRAALEGLFHGDGEQDLRPLITSAVNVADNKFAGLSGRLFETVREEMIIELRTSRFKSHSELLTRCIGGGLLCKGSTDCFWAFATLHAIDQLVLRSVFKLIKPFEDPRNAGSPIITA